MTPKHQTGLLFVYYITNLNLLEYLFQNLKFTFLHILSICELHILLSRTAQISLELHFCVELHTIKRPWSAWQDDVSKNDGESLLLNSNPVNYDVTLMT